MYTIKVIYLSTVTQRHPPNSEITAEEAVKTLVTNTELQMNLSPENSDGCKFGKADCLPV